MLNPNCSFGVVSFVCAWSAASHRRKTSRSQERIDRVIVVELYQDRDCRQKGKPRMTQMYTEVSGNQSVSSALSAAEECIRLLDRSACRSLRKTYRPAGPLTGIADMWDESCNGNLGKN